MYQESEKRIHWFVINKSLEVDLVGWLKGHYFVGFYETQKPIQSASELYPHVRYSISYSDDQHKNYENYICLELYSSISSINENVLGGIRDKFRPIESSEKWFYE